VVNGRCGTVLGCLAQVQRWLSLIRSALVPGSLKVAARIVVSHTDALMASERTALLQEVHDRVCATFDEHFDFGERCFATLYSAAGAGDVDVLRDELMLLRSTTVALPASYLEVCDDVLKMARDRRRWPVVPLSSINTRGELGVLPALEDLGFLRRADDVVILEPVTWLSHLMAGFLHPYVAPPPFVNSNVIVNIVLCCLRSLASLLEMTHVLLLKVTRVRFILCVARVLCPLLREPVLTLTLVFTNTQ
jgi:hypothetical protein